MVPGQMKSFCFHTLAKYSTALLIMMLTFQLVSIEPLKQISGTIVLINKNLFFLFIQLPNLNKKLEQFPISALLKLLKQ